jgi:hypothetical protein
MSVDHLLPDLWTDHGTLVVSLLAVSFIVAVAARRLMRRCNTASRDDIEVRAWSYCPKCGTARGREVDTSQTGETGRLPSALLRRGWCREPALDADGRIVLPNDPAAVAWSLWGAVNRSFEAGSLEWQELFAHLDRALRTRYGDTIGGRPMTVQRWNRDPSRTKTEVVGVMLDVERLMGLATPGPPRRI